MPDPPPTHCLSELSRCARSRTALPVRIPTTAPMRQPLAIFICVPCHKRLTIGGERAQQTDAFNLYQNRAARLPSVGTVDMFAAVKQ
jgi:hypothetical protein